jgi:hypothetical protein
VTAKKILRPENRSALSYNERWPFVRLDTSLGIGTLTIIASSGVFVCVVRSLKHSISSCPCSMHDFDLFSTYEQQQPPKDKP